MSKLENCTVDGTVRTDHTISSNTFDSSNHFNMYKRLRGFPLPATSSDSYTSDMHLIGSKNSKIETIW